jgi:hypothetical protein
VGGAVGLFGADPSKVKLTISYHIASDPWVKGALQDCNALRVLIALDYPVDIALGKGTSKLDNSTDLGYNTV